MAISDREFRSNDVEWLTHKVKLSLLGRLSGGLSVALISAVLVGAWGCRPQAKLEPAEGIVTLDGSPVADAAVLFLPVNSDGPPAHGATDEQGRFQLSTNNRPGSAVGQYRVAISKVEIEQILQDEKGETPRGGLPVRVEETHLLPPRYVDAKTSVLSAEVQPSSRNFFTFSLVTDETVGAMTVTGGDQPQLDSATNQAAAPDSSSAGPNQ